MVNRVPQSLTDFLESEFLALGQMQAANIRAGGLASDEDAFKFVTCALLSTALNLWCEAACKRGKVTFAQAQQQVINALAAVAKDGADNRRASGLHVDEVLQ